MSTEALVLAVISTVRPTTAAAVWAMLVGSRPRRLLAAYLLAGLGVSLTVGVVVVLAVGDAVSRRAASSLRGQVLVLLGLAALLGAVAVRLGWLRRSREAVPATAHRRRLSPAGAAVTGVLTHLPGVFYLAGLSAISAAGAGAGGEVAQVVVYNLVWFAPAIAALGLALSGRIPSGDRLAGIVAWGRAHQETILTVCFAGVGIWLVVKGVTEAR